MLPRGRRRFTPMPEGRGARAAIMVALRVLIIWLYNNAGKSLFAAILVHDMDNVSVFSLFPNDGGSHYVPAISAALTAIAAALVTILWGPKTLARFRCADPATPPATS